MSLAGRTLGHYEILDQLGAGGMGEVYRARDLTLDRVVALKFIRAGLPGDEMRRRFQQEARALAALDHPYVGTVHGFEEVDGMLFMVLAFVEGRSLEQVLRDGPLTPGRRVLLPRIAEGLAAAHQRGVIHRDIKSSNVMVGDGDVPKLVDFGLARRTDDTRATTSVGATVGTFAYMAPEVVSGQPADARSDQFSLGVLVYEALTGRLPFEHGNPAATLHAIVHDEPPPFPPSLPAASRALEPVMRRCLAKDPGQRFASVADVAVALRSGDAGPAVPARRPARGLHVARVLGAAGIFAGIVLAAWMLRGREHAPSEAMRDHAVAVLEFENLTGDHSLDWMGRGLSELLATALSRSPDLDVYDAQRLANLATPGAAAPGGASSEALKRHGVARAVVGSVVRSGGRLRLQGRVVDVASGRVIHSEWVDGDAGGDVFQLAGGLIHGLQSALEVDVLGQRTGDAWLREITTSSPEAFRLFLSGREAFIDSRWAEAAGDYERTLALDSTFVAARVDLVGCYWNLNDDAKLHLALAAADRLRAHAGRRETLQLDLIAAIISGDPDRIVRAAGELRTLYPENKFFAYLQGRGYFTAKRYTECLAVLEPLVRERYEWAWTYVIAARAHAALGHPDQAVRAYETGMDVTHANPELACTFAMFLQTRGDSARARALLAQAEVSPALQQTPYFESVIRMLRAREFERAGGRDSARIEYAASRAHAVAGSDEAREDSLALARLAGR